jgi:hypothetical protein
MIMITTDNKEKLIINKKEYKNVWWLQWR